MENKQISASPAGRYLNCFLVKRERGKLFGAYDDRVRLAERPHSLVFRRGDESGNRVHRLILLPPDGCTADEKNELSAHPETRNAKVEILGGVAPGLKGFRQIARQIEFRYTETPDSTEVQKVLKSWNNPFFVVKDGCFGFFHNLVNESKEWILLRLEKELAQLKEFEIPQRDEVRWKIGEIGDAVVFVLEKIAAVGSQVFYFYPDRVDELIDGTVRLACEGKFGLVELLVKALNMRETGQHESCTVFEILHNIGKELPDEVVSVLARALNERTAPPYYVAELLGKIGGDAAKWALEEEREKQDKDTHEYVSRALRALEKKNP